MIIKKCVFCIINMSTGITVEWWALQFGDGVNLNVAGFLPNPSPTTYCISGGIYNDDNKRWTTLLALVNTRTYSITQLIDQIITNNGGVNPITNKGLLFSHCRRTALVLIDVYSTFGFITPTILPLSLGWRPCYLG
jgi:hypothetical protein